VVYQRYGAELRRQGKSDKEVAATIASLQAIGDRAKVERWNRILTAPNRHSTRRRTPSSSP
jgi:hypothetical protein